MKITMYELLGMVKDGKAPKKVKYKNMICHFNKEKKTYCLDRSNIELFHIEKLIERLNDEVEIIEEEKKIPEKLDKYADVSGDLACEWTFGEKKLKDKIDEIIDYLDYLKGKGE